MEELVKRALMIYEKRLGEEHSDTASSLNNLAGTLYETRGKDEEAEELYKQALAICERLLGEEHPDTRIVRENYAYLLRIRSHEEGY